MGHVRKGPASLEGVRGVRKGLSNEHVQKGLRESRRGCASPEGVAKVQKGLSRSKRSRASPKGVAPF